MRIFQEKASKLMACTPRPPRRMILRVIQAQLSDGDASDSCGEEDLENRRVLLLQKATSGGELLLWTLNVWLLARVSSSEGGGTTGGHVNTTHPSMYEMLGGVLFKEDEDEPPPPPPAPSPPPPPSNSPPSRSSPKRINDVTRPRWLRISLGGFQVTHFIPPYETVDMKCGVRCRQ